MEDISLGWYKGIQVLNLPARFWDTYNKLRQFGLQLKGNWNILFHEGFPGIQFTNHCSNEYEQYDKYFYNSEPAEISKLFRRKHIFNNAIAIMDDKNTLEYLVDESSLWQEHISYYDQDGNKVKQKAEELKDLLKQQTLEILSGIYKIHLQPKLEHRDLILQHLVHLLNTNKKVRKNIAAWKVIVPYCRVYEENFPVLVIYPTYGKESFELVLNTIISTFMDFDDREVGLGITPRYNLRYNDLIYFTQYHGDNKEYLQEKYPQQFSSIFLPPEYAFFQ